MRWNKALFAVLTVDIGLGQIKDRGVIFFVPYLRSWSIFWGRVKVPNLGVKSRSLDRQSSTQGWWNWSSKKRWTAWMMPKMITNNLTWLYKERFVFLVAFSHREKRVQNDCIAKACCILEFNNMTSTRCSQTKFEEKKDLLTCNFIVHKIKIIELTRNLAIIPKCQSKDDPTCN